MSRETELLEFRSAFDDATPMYDITITGGTKLVGRSKDTGLLHFRVTVTEICPEAGVCFTIKSANRIYADFETIHAAVPFSSTDEEVRAKRDEVLKDITAQIANH